METAAQIKAEVHSNEEQIKALKSEILDLSDAFGKLWEKLADFIERARDLREYKWLKELSDREHAMAVVTAENRQALEESSPIDLDKEMARLRRQRAASRNLLAQLKLHRDWLAETIAEMQKKTSS